MIKCLDKETKSSVKSNHYKCLSVMNNNIIRASPSWHFTGSIDCWRSHVTAAVTAQIDLPTGVTSTHHPTLSLRHKTSNTETWVSFTTHRTASLKPFTAKQCQRDSAGCSSPAMLSGRPPIQHLFCAF
eukprot:Selendium_serpulae@DN1436_c0_g1_i1.p1